MTDAHPPCVCGHTFTAHLPLTGPGRGTCTAPCAGCHGYVPTEPPDAQPWTTGPRDRARQAHRTPDVAGAAVAGPGPAADLVDRQVEVSAMRARHQPFRSGEDGDCRCGQAWPCAVTRLCDAVDEAREEIVRLTERLPEWVADIVVERDTARAALLETIAQRDELGHKASVAEAECARLGDFALDQEGMRRQAEDALARVEALCARAEDLKARGSTGWLDGVTLRAAIAGDPPAAETCLVGHDLYGACELPFRHDEPHSRIPGGATEPNTWAFDAGDPPAAPSSYVRRHPDSPHPYAPGQWDAEYEEWWGNCFCGKPLRDPVHQVAAGEPAAMYGPVGSLSCRILGCMTSGVHYHPSGPDSRSGT